MNRRDREQHKKTVDCFTFIENDDIADLSANISSVELWLVGSTSLRRQFCLLLCYTTGDIYAIIKKYTFVWNESDRKVASSEDLKNFFNVFCSRGSYEHKEITRSLCTNSALETSRKNTSKSGCNVLMFLLLVKVVTNKIKTNDLLFLILFLHR